MSNYGKPEPSRWRRFVVAVAAWPIHFLVMGFFAGVGMWAMIIINTDPAPDIVGLDGYVLSSGEKIKRNTAMGTVGGQNTAAYPQGSALAAAPERPDLTDYTPWMSISFMVAHAWREGGKGTQWETVSNAVRLRWEQDHFVERGNP